MSRAEDLLDVARSKFRPIDRQRSEADWRRAVSDAYYALFHGLLDHACAPLHAASSEPALLDALRRSYQHLRMSKACKQIADTFAAQERGNVQKPIHVKIQTLFPGTRISAEAGRLCGLFVKLQEQRHAADYAGLETFSLWHALFAIGDAEEALEALSEISRVEAATLHFLLRTDPRDLRLG